MEPWCTEFKLKSWRPFTKECPLSSLKASLWLVTDSQTKSYLQIITPWLSFYSCRVHGMPFYFGFLAPICLILISNLVIFAIIMYKLSSRPSRSMEQRDTSEGMQRLKRAFGIMILMGLTWLFGAFAVSDARLVFQYLFAVCNSLQGFAIFLFYCLSQKNVRDAWRAFVTCDTRSELKKTTDSYYERRRLSSASQKTNTLLPRTRTNSSTVVCITIENNFSPL